MKKWLLVLLVGVSVAGIAAVVALRPGPPKTPFRTNYDRVRRGMTVNEVHAIMGEPSEAVTFWIDDLPGEGYGYPGCVPTRGPYLRLRPEERDAAYIYYADGRVTRKTYLPGDRHEPTVLESVLERLGW